MDRETIVVEGRWCVEALLESTRFEVIEVWRAKGSHEDLAPSESVRPLIREVSPAALSEVAGYSFHRGILALAKRPPENSAAAAAKETKQGLFVACPELADAANLGVIVRTAAALGSAGVLVASGRGADIFSRKSIRASSGAVFRLPVWECPDLESDLRTFRKEGFFLMGSAIGEESTFLSEAPKPTKGIILFGPEQGGLGEKWLDLCQARICIPMKNKVDSLNVAASAAIVLHELMKNPESFQDGSA